MKKKDIELIVNEEGVDLIAFFSFVKANKKVIYKTIGVCLSIGIIIAFVSPRKYSASATILPGENVQGGSMGGISALANLAGVKIGSDMGADISGIPAAIYPEVLNSYRFKKEFIYEEFSYEGYAQPLSMIEYVENDTLVGLGQNILRYTFKLPWTIIEHFSDKSISNDTNNYGVEYITYNEKLALKDLKDFFEIEVNTKNGLVTISALDTEPILVAQKVHKAVEILQEFIKDHKTRQARMNVSLLEELYEIKQQEYKDAQSAFFSYKDMHRNAVYERAGFEYQQLSDDYEIATSVYKGITQQLEQAKVSVAEKMPSFNVIEPAIIPSEKYSPRRSIICVASILLGFIFGISILICKVALANLKDNYNK